MKRSKKNIKGLVLPLLVCIFLCNNINGQTITSIGPHFPPKVFDCSNTDNPNVTLLAIGGFDETTPNGDGTVTQCFDLLANYGIDPASISDSIPLSIFYDGGLNSALFSTSNGYSEVGQTNPLQGTVGDHFAFVKVPNDGSGQLCVTVDANNNALEEISFYATVEHGIFSGGGVVSTGFIDNEIIFNDDPGNDGECEIGTLPMASNGTASDLMDVNINFTISEVIEGDSRTITLIFEACGVMYNQSIDPEPVPNVPGVAQISVTLSDVPGDCDELSYSFCSDPGEQSYGVGGITIITECFDVPVFDLSLDKTVNTAQAAIGDTITYTITVNNESIDPSTGIEVTDALPTGLVYVSDDGGGTYDSNTGIWTIATLAGQGNAVLNIQAVIEADGVIYNQAEITAMNGNDNDSTPGNGVESEDDMDNACVSIPIEVCSNEVVDVDLLAPTGLTNYQWYLDGNPIVGATNQAYTATGPGVYTFTTDGNGPTGDCEGELCCPVIIELIECCEPIQCVPVTLTKLN